MNATDRSDEYLEYLAQGLGHADRHAGLRGYCTGLMLPVSRKSVEPMAARVDPLHASAKHQALHHFVAQAEWSDAEMLRRVCRWSRAEDGFQARRLVGHRRHRISEEGTAFGWRGSAVLRDAWQTGQAPDRRERLVGLRSGQPSGGVAAPFAAGMGRRLAASAQAECAR
jgi:hypothetical protein